jgi:hypothetical protein
VEREDQVRFLREIGCSRLQGFYYSKAIPLEMIIDRYKNGVQVGYENLDEADYYEAMGRVNLYDYAVIANEDNDAFHHFFDTLPMGIIEIKGDMTRFVRSNAPYRDFVKRFFHLDLSYEGTDFVPYDAAFLYNIVKTCCVNGSRSFYDEKMPDGSTVHSFARRIAKNPVTGAFAVVIVVLSITEPGEGATYADIARALASDYYSIYYVDMETEDFIEYSSLVGSDEMALERHGSNFFAKVKQDTEVRMYKEDQESFLECFTKDNIIKELDKQNVFMTTYRLVDTGEPVYANMKITRLEQGSNRIIIGISLIDSQSKQSDVN